jgi:hypothetical protein
MPTLDEIASDGGKLATEFQVVGVRDFPPRIVLRIALVDGTAADVVFRPEMAHRVSDDMLRAAASVMRPLTAAEL